MINYRLVGKRIREKRKKQKITQEQLAEYLGISVPYISRIENARTQVSLKILSKISVYLHVDIAYLLSGTVIDTTSYGIKEISSLLEGSSAKEKDTIITIIREISNML